MRFFNTSTIFTLVTSAALLWSTDSPARAPIANHLLLALGRGYDYVKEEPLQDCLRPTTSVSVGGTTTEYSIEKINSYAELSKAMDISAKATLSLLSGAG
ncbi:MAG TPA: hypothetical protein PK156_34210, partial [Polyangium sp.]|nr:hypothetical protein [Polyangium sp.]